MLLPDLSWQQGAWQHGVLVLALSVALEGLYSEVPAGVHPVVWLGKLVQLLLRLEPAGARGRLLFGLLLTLSVMSVAVVTFQACDFWLPAGVQPLFEALILQTTFAVRGLMTAGKRMRRGLATSLEQAREALRHLCSRDPSHLLAPQLIAATIESLVENVCDAFVAPLVWFTLAGVPGALAYRAVNTLDSMIGYRGRYEHTGKFAARLDDVLNYVPARLSAALLLLVGAARGYPVRRAWRAFRTEARKTSSPNAGVTISVAAGLLGVTLEKAGEYALIGGTRVASSEDVAEVERWVFWSFVLCVVGLGLALSLGASWSQ